MQHDSSAVVKIQLPETCYKRIQRETMCFKRYFLSNSTWLQYLTCTLINKPMSLYLNVIITDEYCSVTEH